MKTLQPTRPQATPGRLDTSMCQLRSAANFCGAAGGSRHTHSDLLPGGRGAAAGPPDPAAMTGRDSCQRLNTPIDTSQATAFVPSAASESAVQHAS